ncbi:MAG: polysaccharide biosynthesis protein [Oscillospiraceae bacterium]|nr:polysaccharide biosynthesis protein [Oscillospiraceae bacterium]
MEQPQQSKTTSFLKGAAIMSAATIVVRIIGALFKIPLFSMFRTYDVPEATSFFTSAYNIFGLLLIVGTAGLPVAVSKMVSSAHERRQYKDVMTIFSVSRIVFMTVGGVSTLLMVIFAPIIAVWIEGSANAIRAVAPGVFLVCWMGAYRGTHQGHGNMMPTAMSQLVEATGKLIFGLLLVFLVVRGTLSISGVMSYDAASAGIAGVTIGSILGAFFMAGMWYKQRKQYTQCINPEQVGRSRKSVLNELLRLAIPVTLAAIILQLANIVDMSVALRRLITMYGVDRAGANAMFAPIAESHPITGFPQGIVVAMAVSLIPALSSAIAAKNREKVYGVVGSAFHVSAVLIMPSVLGLVALGTPIMQLLFRSGTHGGVIMSVAALNIMPLCMASLTNAMLQAMGKPTIPMINMIIGGVTRVAATFMLMSWLGPISPRFALIGAVISPVIAYFVIFVLNLSAIAQVIPWKRLTEPFVRPLLAALIMSGCVYYINRGMMTILPGGLDSRLMTTIGVAVSVGVGVLIYGLLAIWLGIVRRRDFERLPKGEKVADFFNVSAEPPKRRLSVVAIAALLVLGSMLAGMMILPPLYTI